MSDFHVQPELGAEKGMALALQHAMKQKPDLVLGGGDLIMDAFAQTEARTKLQWSIFTRLMKEHCKMPYKCTLGNHDVWGWSKKESQTDGSERLWGKKWFTDLLGYPNTYYSFNQGGWHFVVLDNIFLTPDGYNGVIEPAQMEWLAGDLASTKLPTLVLTHIPLLSITPVVGAYDPAKGEWNVGGNVMTKNLKDIQALFRKHAHVKIALSGHTHLLDRVDYDGVSYMCGGAVSGAWWQGNNANTPPGYRVLDLAADGTFQEKYMAWGWTNSLMKAENSEFALLGS